MSDITRRETFTTGVENVNPVAPTASPALSVVDVSCAFGGVQAVQHMTLEVPSGSFLAIIGPNGAGKSTLLDCISGRNRTYRGRVTALGHDITRLPLHKIARLGVVRTFQVARPFRKLTVLANLMCAPPHQRGERLAWAFLGGWRQQELEFLRQARASLDIYDLSAVESNNGSELSGGQERLVELSRAALCSPRLLLLDEPFAGVSPSNRARLANHLARLNSEHGITVVMVEHRLEWVERLCSRIVVMADGATLAQGTMRELRSNQQVIDAYFGVVTK